MDEDGEDRISNLPEGVVSHILSYLSTKDSMKTSILSKDWELKWTTSLYNIELDDESMTILRMKLRKKKFISFIERVLQSTQSSKIKCFRLSCFKCNLDPHYLGKCITRALMLGVQDLEIKILTNRKDENVDVNVDDLYNCQSLTKLGLSLRCTLYTSRMMDCFLNLKSLRLGNNVTLLNEASSNTSAMLLSFPVLEELRLTCSISHHVKSVVIDAPALISFVYMDPCWNAVWNNCLIKIVGAKLEKFETYGDMLDKYVLVAPSISKACFTSHGRQILGFRAHAILKRFMSTLEYIIMSTEIVKALTESFPHPCFIQLKKLVFRHRIEFELLTKVLQMMPSLETLYLHIPAEEMKSLPSGIASGLKVVELSIFEGTPGQIQFAVSVLKNADNLEKLSVIVPTKSLMPRAKISRLLSKCPKSSGGATVEVTPLRLRKPDCWNF